MTIGQREVKTRRLSVSLDTNKALLIPSDAKRELDDQ